MAYLVKSRGQHMKQKAADELMGRQNCLFDFAVVGIVLVTENDPAIIDGTDAMVTDGHSVGVTANVLYHLLGIRKRGFGEDDRWICTEISNPSLKSLG